MAAFDSFDLDDMKLVYTTLQAQLLDVEELMDSRFLSELQTFLRARAEASGVDTSVHADWASWLAARDKGHTSLRLVTD